MFETLRLIIEPMNNGLYLNCNELFIGNSFELTSRLKVIYATLINLWPNGNFAIKVSDQLTDAIFYFHENKYYDAELNEIKSELPKPSLN